MRQVARSISEFRRSPFVGAPRTVADSIEQWFNAGTFDGINLAFRTDDDLNLFVDGVVPIRRSAGCSARYEADTLRGNLGLPIPDNRNTREPHLVND